MAIRFRILAGVRTGTRLDLLPRWCGARDHSGIDEIEEWRDWTSQETTPDQSRIEDQLALLGVTGRRVLHVGIGNSEFARRFHGEARSIDGITIQPREVEHAATLHLPHYRVGLQSKYAPDLWRHVWGPYDYIVDNNPTTFCCCRWHLSSMMTNYAGLLQPGGVILTDTVGLGWTSQPNDARWKLTRDEWRHLGAQHGLLEVRYTDYVVGLRRPEGGGRA